MVPTLVFDGECGFCMRALGWLRLMDGGRRIETLPYQRPGVPESIGATAEECAGSVQWRGADGTRLEGAAAINAALAEALRCPLPVTVYRRSSSGQERLYRWVSERRDQLPGVRPWCDRYPGDCG